MDFRFLGPLEVRSAGRPLPLGGQRQRGLLAVLLLNANTVVSIDRLVDDVWGETAPRTVHAYIQNCISRLRAVLGRDAIETHPSGYLLRVEASEIDAVRFARAVEAARDLDAPGRVAALGEALALWRGQPLSEFAFEPFAQPEIARLDELRLTAVEDRLAAQLEIGLHGTALPELEALAARHPARERVRYLQMLALYRAGRQHDALTAYQEARRELVEQFGLDPGEELRALERMILAQDPSLRRSAPRREPEQTGSCIVLAAEPAAAQAEEVLLRADGDVRVQGDTVTAAWGVPHSHDGDALRALAAAAALHTAVPGARIAIERMPTTTHDVDPRLVDSASPGDTMLGPRVLPLVAHAVDVIADPHGGFRLLHVDQEAEPLPRRFGTTLVGRSDELARLEAELQRVRASSSPHCVVLLGDAGIGKTRLARELAARVPGAALWARCAPHTGRDPLAELVEQVTVEAVLAGEPDAGKIGAALALRGRSRWAEERWGLRRLLEACARSGPLVVVVDDLQWASANVLDLVDYLIGWARAPILVLALARPDLLDRRPDLGARAWHLDPLRLDDALRLVRALPESSALEPYALTSVAEIAEGNPLYLEQIVAWSSEEHAERVPPTIELLIAMRVERLPENERRVLERASVVGTEFWRGGVEAASPEEERTEVASALMSLARRRLVRPAPTHLEGEDGFRFHHALVRDVVYAGIEEDTRARLHAAVARSLGPDEESDALAGYHLEHAAVVDTTLGDEAARRLGAAGLRALRRIDPVPATDLLSRALRLGPEGTARRELEWGLATAIKFAGEVARADELLDDVAARASDAGDERNELRARIEQVWWRLAHGVLEVDDAERLLNRAARTFEEADDHFAAARAWDITGAFNGVYLLRAIASEQAEQRARVQYALAGSTSGASDARLAGAALLGPTPAGVAIRQCEELLAASETPVWASFVQPFLACLLAMQGRFDEAHAALEEARAGRAEFADPRTLDTSWAFLAAEVESRVGDYESAERILAVAAERLRETGDSEWISLNAAALSSVRLQQGLEREALTLADTALQGVPSAHLTVSTIARRVRAVALARLGRESEALAEATRNLADLEQSDALVEQARAHAALAEVLVRSGDEGAANAQQAKAVALLERKGDVVGARGLANG